MFAKLFETEEYGQILVKLDRNDASKPEIRTFYEPEGFGVCSVAMSWDDTDRGLELAEQTLKEYTLEKAIQVVETIKKNLGI